MIPKAVVIDVHLFLKGLRYADHAKSHDTHAVVEVITARRGHRVRRDQGSLGAAGVEAGQVPAVLDTKTLRKTMISVAFFMLFGVSKPFLDLFVTFSDDFDGRRLEAFPLLPSPVSKRRAAVSRSDRSCWDGTPTYFLNASHRKLPLR